MVADSHVLLWWLRETGKLSRRASEYLRLCEANREVLHISGATLWELEWKRRCGKLSLKASVREWLPRLRRLPWLTLVETSPEIWLLAAELDWKHRDPADRIIAATALHHGVPVLSKDRVFHLKSSPVEAVW